MTTKTIKATRREWPLVVWIAMLGFALSGYVIGRIALNSMPHYYHWASGLISGGVGIAFGWWRYRRKGDIL